MQINLKCSYVMDIQKTVLESRTIRMPQRYREQLGFDLGQFIGLRTNSGTLISLQVMPAFKDDLSRCEESAYVTTVMYEQLNCGNKTADFEIVNDITLGTDPEFFLLSGTKILPANRYFKKWNPVGSDGMLAEIRPSPSVSEDVVVNNIRRQLGEARQRIDARGHKHAVLHAASAYAGVTAGFHLHSGLPKAMLGDNNENRLVLTQIVRALDYYVGLPCVLQEGIQECQRRCATFLPYGKAGDFRLDFRTLEYRVPGGIMLKHPILTRGLLALGAVVVEDAISRVKHCTDDFTDKAAMQTCASLNKLYPNVPSQQEATELINTPGIEGASRNINSIMADVGKMVGINKRAEAVNALFANLTTNFSSNIDDNWETRNVNYNTV